MKKWGWRQVSAMGLVLSLTFSSTAFASELTVEDSTEAVQQSEAAEETEAISESAEQTEPVSETEESNGLEMILFSVENEISETTADSDNTEETLVLRNITLEELESIDEQQNTDEETGEAQEMPQTVMVVFQPENYWNEEETEESETASEESQPVESVIDITQETEIETDSNEEEDELPVIILTEEQEEQVIQIASHVSETIVVINGGSPDDELMFKSHENVKAVLSMNETTEEAFTEAVKTLNLEEIYKEYQDKITKSSIKAAMKVAATLTDETELPQAETLLPGSVLSRSSSSSSTESSTSSDTESTESTTSAGSTTQGSSSTSDTESSTTTQQITITLVPELLEEEDDCLYAVYEISGPDDLVISEATFTLTYDSTKMDYDSDYSDAGEDVYDDFNYTGTDNTGSVTITLKSSDGTSKSMSGSMLDLGFELKSEAEVGDIFNLKLEVTSLKNGTTELTTNSNYNITVSEESIKAVAYTDEEETEEETETQTQTQTQTQTPSLQTAAKTGDTTNTILWIVMITASMGICIILLRKRKHA